MSRHKVLSWPASLLCIVVKLQLEGFATNRANPSCLLLVNTSKINIFNKVKRIYSCTTIVLVFCQESVTIEQNGEQAGEVSLIQWKPKIHPSCPENLFSTADRLYPPPANIHWKFLPNDKFAPGELSMFVSSRNNLFPYHRSLVF